MWGRGKPAPSLGPPDESEQHHGEHGRGDLDTKTQHEDARFGAPQHSRSGRHLDKHKEYVRAATTVWWKLDDLDNQETRQHGKSVTDTSEVEQLPCLIFHPQSMFRVRHLCSH